MLGKNPYRVNELSKVAKQTSPNNFKCNWFGCSSNNQVIPDGVYLFGSSKQEAMAFQECTTCHREYSFLFRDSNELQLHSSNNSATGWQFLYNPFPLFKSIKFIDFLEVEHEAEIRVVGCLSDVKNIRHIKYKEYFICSKVGCRPFKLFDSDGDLWNHICRRCGRAIPELGVT
jgi:hypothetical protein